MEMSGSDPLLLSGPHRVVLVPVLRWCVCLRVGNTLLRFMQGSQDVSIDQLLLGHCPPPSPAPPRSINPCQESQTPAEAVDTGLRDRAERLFSQTLETSDLFYGGPGPDQNLLGDLRVHRFHPTTKPGTT